MKVLVVGSKGFIGTHCLAYYHKKPGISAYGCDVVADYVSPNYIRIDATNADYREVFQKGEYELCINCSGAANVQDSLVNPLRDFQLNAANVFKMLDAIRLFSPKCRFINLSSAAVYGNPLYNPVEESQAANPLSPYGWHKWQSELACLEFYRLFEIPTSSLRIFSAFGPGLKKQIFWDMHQKRKVNECVQLGGTGKETRDFIYIADLLNAIDIVAEKGEGHGNVINVANGIEISIEEAANKFFEYYSPDTEICFSKTSRVGDPQFWRADIGKLSALGYSQAYTFEQGIKEYVAWLQEEK